MSSEDRDFMVNFVIVLGVLVLFAVIMFFVARIISTVGSGESAAKEDPLVSDLVDDRIRPVVTMDDLNTYDPSAPAPAARSGAEVYDLACQSCHAAGVLGAPKTGDASAWGGRLGDKGFDKLVYNAINGINAMPARGGNPSLTDTEIARAIDYMLGESGVASPYQEGAASAATTPAKAPAPETPPAPAPSAEPAAAAAAQAGAGEDPVTATPEPTARPVTAVEAVDPERLAYGENRYKMICASCHAMGVAGAPRLGDKAAWGPRMALGIEGLTNSVINGKGAMPPRGGAMNYSNDDIRAAVEYMVSTVN